MDNNSEHTKARKIHWPRSKQQRGAAQGQLSLSFTKTCNILWHVLWFDLKIVSNCARKLFGATEIVNETFAVIWQQCVWVQERERERNTLQERAQRTWREAAQYRERESFYYAPSTTMLPAANEARAGNATSHSLRGSLCVHVSVWMSNWASLCMYVCVCVC